MESRERLRNRSTKASPQSKSQRRSYKRQMLETSARRRQAGPSLSRLRPHPIKEKSRRLPAVNSDRILTRVEPPASRPSTISTRLRRGPGKSTTRPWTLFPTPLPEFVDCPTLNGQLVHHTFSEELVFWTVKYEFSQNMLPDSQYKEALTTAIVLHYSWMSMMSVKSSNSDSVSNR